jgi:hypothetical protein
MKNILRIGKTIADVLYITLAVIGLVTYFLLYINVLKIG